MAVRLLANEVSDLCLGKPAIKCLSAVSATVGDAISVLKRSDEPYVSVWTCDHTKPIDDPTVCKCIGKVCMSDVICFLAREENVSAPVTALEAPVRALIAEGPPPVRHLEPNASLLEAIELVQEGAQNLVVPIRTRSKSSSRKILLQNHPCCSYTLHDNREYCWLTQEDIIRYLLNLIALFCPTPVCPINSLGIINTESIITVHYDSPAVLALPFIAESVTTQTAIAIVDNKGLLLGEISPSALNSCDISASAAILTLSVGDLMAYIDCGSPPEDLIRLVKERLEEDKKFESLAELLDEDSAMSSASSVSSYSSSSDEEFGSGSILGRSRSQRLSYSVRMARSSEAIMCHPWSSLVAVMVQALAHRVNHVWVVEEDGSLDGIVTFASMLKVFHERLKSMS